MSNIDPAKIMELANAANNAAAPKYINFILYSRFGRGKTSLAATAPQPIQFVMFDPSGDNVLKRQIADPNNDIRVLKLPTTLTDIEKIASSGIFTLTDAQQKEKAALGQSKTGIEYLRDYLVEWASNGYFDTLGTLVFDSLTNLDKLMMEHVLAKDKTAPFFGPARQHYNPMMQRLGKLLEWCCHMRCHFICTAHESVYSNSDLGVWEKTLLTSGRVTKESTPALFSEIFYLDKKRGKPPVVITEGDSTLAAQTKIGAGILETFEEPDISALLARCGYDPQYRAKWKKQNIGTFAEEEDQDVPEM